MRLITYSLIAIAFIVAMLWFRGHGLPHYTDGRGHNTAHSSIAALSTALNAFYVDNDYYPYGTGGLGELINKPAGASKWRGPYLVGGIPNDPWGRPFHYEYPGIHNPNSFDLSSYGPDGVKGTVDDLTNWVPES